MTTRQAWKFFFSCNLASDFDRFSDSKAAPSNHPVISFHRLSIGVRKFKTWKFTCAFQNRRCTVLRVCKQHTLPWLISLRRDEDDFLCDTHRKNHVNQKIIFPKETTIARKYLITRYLVPNDGSILKNICGQDYEFLRSGTCFHFNSLNNGVTYWSSLH